MKLARKVRGLQSHPTRRVLGRRTVDPLKLKCWRDHLLKRCRVFGDGAGLGVQCRLFEAKDTFSSPSTWTSVRA